MRGKRVLLRSDINVPVGSDGKVTKGEDFKIVKSLPTIEYLLKKKAAIILTSHLGRPGGKTAGGVYDPKLKMDPVAKRLQYLLGKKAKVIKLDENDSPEVKAAAEKLKPGQILLLENIRFHPEEGKNSKPWGKRLASYADLYVNDAFASSHKQTSVHAVTYYLPSYAGLLMMQEVESVTKLIEKPVRPLVVIIGGAKISTKVGVIKKMLEVADEVILGGALANNVFIAKGYKVGKSRVERKYVPVIKKLKITDTHFNYPVDAMASTSLTGKGKNRVTAIAGNNVNPDEYILDIGPDTINLYSRIIASAKTIFFNGPMGLIEVPAFSKGTEGVVDAILKSKAKVLTGGGETAMFLDKYAGKRLANKKNIYVSTGGGAMLELIEQGTLDTIERLRK